MVHLRAMEPEDLDLLYRIENDPSLWAVGVTNVPYSRYLLHDYIATATANAYADGQVRLIIETDKGETVGVADLVNISPAHRRAEVGIVIERHHRRQGYATETLDLLAYYALRTLHLHQLYAVIAVDNTTSINLFSRQGFTRTAQLPDWLFDGRTYCDAVLLQRVLI